jgi:hypothetical protein
MLKTNFWRNAAAALPERVRARHLADIEQAERIELAIDGALEAVARAKASFATRFQTPRAAH